MVFSHVDIKPSGPWDLLELTLGAGCASDVLEASDNLEHRRQGHLAGVPTKASVRTNTIVNVDVHRPVEADLVRLREVLGFAISAHLKAASATWWPCRWEHYT